MIVISKNCPFRTQIPGNRLGILFYVETQKRKKNKYLTYSISHDSLILTFAGHFPVSFLTKKFLIYSVFKYLQSPKIQLKKLIKHSNVYITPPPTFNCCQGT